MNRPSATDKASRIRPGDDRVHPLPADLFATFAAAVA
jgi:hypothetical protein